MLEIVLLAALGGLRLCCLEPLRATSVSMEPAVPQHAILIVDRTAFREGRRPLRGDLVVFDSPERVSERLVKRVVGLPGDTVAIQDRVLHLDGERAGSVASCDTQACSATETLGKQRYRVTYALEPYLPGEGEWAAGEGYVVLGDNRSHSWDSRFFGPIPATALRGRVLARVDAAALASALRLIGALI